MLDPAEELKELERLSLRRRMYEVESPQAAEIVVEGKRYINFSSNDYLGLAQHPEVIEAFRQGLSKWGAGSGASRLISGSLSPHLQLEQRLAAWKGKSACRVFANGYSTSLGVVSGLLGKDDVVILDKLSHASLIDGAKLSGATIRIFPHNHVGKLQSLLEKYKSHSGRVLVVTEAVFSMDGDLAALREIVRLKEEYNALLLVDEAHALGVRGTMGLAQELGLSGSVDLHMGTLGKAAGVAGGYLACEEELAELIIHKSRSFIYSTAPPPAQCVAALKALEIIHAEEGTQLRNRLWGNIQLFAKLMQMEGWPESAIIPISIGESKRALEMSSALREQGVIVPAVRYPTVPRNTARLRVTISAAHRREHLEALAKLLLDR